MVFLGGLTPGTFGKTAGRGKKPLKVPTGILGFFLERSLTFWGLNQGREMWKLREWNPKTKVLGTFPPKNREWKMGPRNQEFKERLFLEVKKTNPPFTSKVKKAWK